MRLRFFLISILVLAAVLRLWKLDIYPTGFTPDEASFGYDAYSILKTGKDQWGESFPLSFRSFGDYKAPLYTYLTIPFVAIFGLTEFAVRLPNAIFGILAVLVVYFLTKELLKVTSNQYAIRYMPYAATLLLAISPWHISLSRGAFEANLTILLMPLGVLAFLKGLPAGGQGLRDGRWMLLASFVFGLNLFSYHSAKLVTPLITMVLIVWKWTEVKELLRGAKLLHRISFVILGGFLILALYSMIFSGGKRAGDIGIFNPTGGWGAVADRRYEAVQMGLPDSLARIFSNKLTYTVSEFVKNYLSYLSPTFLFTQGAGEATYGMIPGIGVVYLFELPFLLAALWFFIKKPNKTLGFILMWAFLSPVPAALAKGPGFAANRVAVMMPAIQILSAYGGIVVWEWYRKFKVQSTLRRSELWRRAIKFKVLLLVGYGIFALGGFLFFLEAYFYHGPRINAPSMSYGWEEAMVYINSISEAWPSGLESNYDEIVVSRAFSEPHIFVAFSKRWDPQDYQRESQDWRRFESQGLPFIDQLGQWHLGKYTFRNLHYPVDQKLSSTLLVGRAQDFPEGIDGKIITFPDGNPAIIIVQTEK